MTDVDSEAVCGDVQYEEDEEEQQAANGGVLVPKGCLDYLYCASERMKRTTCRLSLDSSVTRGSMHLCSFGLYGLGVNVSDSQRQLLFTDLSERSQETGDESCTFDILKFRTDKFFMSDTFVEGTIQFNRLVLGMLHATHLHMLKRTSPISAKRHTEYRDLAHELVHCAETERPTYKGWRRCAAMYASKGAPRYMDTINWIVGDRARFEYTAYCVDELNLLSSFTV
jgi:hypothetical protein